MHPRLEKSVPFILNKIVSLSSKYVSCQVLLKLSGCHHRFTSRIAYYCFRRHNVAEPLSVDGWTDYGFIPHMTQTFFYIFTNAVVKNILKNAASLMNLIPY